MCESKEGHTELLRTVGLLSAPSGTVLKIDTRPTFAHSRTKETIVTAEGYSSTITEKYSSITQNLVEGKGAAGFDQDFYKLREQLYKSKKLFEDPKFPANNDSLYFSQPPKKAIVWKRPYVVQFYY